MRVQARSDCAEGRALGFLLTSNKSYGDWGGIFGDPVLASAILDRLLHHSTTINIRGKSYRLREREKAGLFPSQSVGLFSSSGASSGASSGEEGSARRSGPADE